jgi:hypothetical protein
VSEQWTTVTRPDGSQAAHDDRDGAYRRAVNLRVGYWRFTGAAGDGDCLPPATGVSVYVDRGVGTQLVEEINFQDSGRPTPTTREEAARDAGDYFDRVCARHPGMQPDQMKPEYVEHVLSRPGMWPLIARLLPPIDDEDADVAAPERGGKEET